MARIRTIKPDAFHSDSLSQVHREVRWTFAGLWTYCDDEGRGRDDVRLIKAALYPLDDDVTTDVLADDLTELEDVGCICRYEVGGRAFMHVPSWGHQKINRPTASKYPPCPSHDGGLMEDSLSDHGALTDDSLAERKGKEQGKEQGSAPRNERVSEPDLFDAFWDAYPRKASKGQARKAWSGARKKVSQSSLVAAAVSFAATSAKTEAQFIPHPATWLNGERWADETPTPAPTGPVRNLPMVHDLERAPDGLSPVEYDAWDRAQRAARAAQ